MYEIVKLYFSGEDIVNIIFKGDNGDFIHISMGTQDFGDIRRDYILGNQVDIRQIWKLKGLPVSVGGLAEPKE